MSAPAINAATPPSPGPAAGIGAGAPTDKGPLAVFEALLAAFTGAQAEPGAIGAAAKAANGKGAQSSAVPADGETATGDAASPTTPGDAATTDAQTTDAAAQAAACNAALILPTAASPVAQAAVSATEGDVDESAGQSVTAWGRDKLPGQPAAPALANRVAKAAADDAAPELPTGETTKGQPSPNASPRATAKLDVPAPPPLNAPAPSPAPPPPAATAGSAPIIPVDTAPAAVVDALVAPQAAAGAKGLEQAAPIAPAAPKDKAQAAKAARNDNGRADTAPGTLAKTGAAAFAPISPVADAAPKSGADDHAALAAATEAKPEADAPSASADAGAATASTTNASTQVHPGAVPVRGSPQTVANLAAEIAKKLEGRSTRFDLELNPAGLGRVDVRMEIGATGRMTAAMTFDTPQAAAELRARAAELQRHLEQAGFDLSGGLSFDVAGDRGQGRQAQQQQDNNTGQAFRGRAFQEALATAGEAAQAAASGALNLRRSLLAGVDIRI